jgi:transposase
MLGVDDWAWRKRQRYGTMLKDLERLHVIDLLPVRSAESFAHWLGLHPEVEVITHDRSGLYADGGRQGAPSAVQITDRYHLVSNLGAAMERDLQQLQIDARRQLTQTVAGRPREAKKRTLIEARRQRCRQARYERYLAVVELHRQGHTQLATRKGSESGRRPSRDGCTHRNFRSARFAAIDDQTKPSSFKSRSADCNHH